MHSVIKISTPLELGICYLDIKISWTNFRMEFQICWRNISDNLHQRFKTKEKSLKYLIENVTNVQSNEQQEKRPIQ